VARTERFWDLDRLTGPTAHDAAAVLVADLRRC